MYCKATQDSLAVLSVLCTRLTHCWLPLLTLEAAALLPLCIVLLLLECRGIGISQSVAFGHCSLRLAVCTCIPCKSFHSCIAHFFQCGLIHISSVYYRNAFSLLPCFAIVYKTPRCLFSGFCLDIHFHFKGKHQGENIW